MNPFVLMGVGIVAILIALYMYFTGVGMMYSLLVLIAGALFLVVGVLKKREEG